MELEQIRKVALAYYQGSSDETKQHAEKLFKKMDADGDGKVSFNEFSDFFMKSKGLTVPKLCFEELDKDGNGFMDLEESIVLFYIIQTRRISCDGCGSLIKGMYFTCVQCFFNTKTAVNYNLCCDCHRSGKSAAGCEHNTLVDNYALLQDIKATLNMEKADKSEELLGENIGEELIDRAWDIFGEDIGILDAAGEAVEAGNAAGEILLNAIDVATNCSIM
ncbi:PREDICTED: uncharacterized protein LOC104609874 isoform X1 [Nelumbo nucifera]|uniref:Uncharacterized protein LOC104609874 isoform X1 n=1 Tax=Nelumbo nucifera TaxID=4432 RepID=A0A1U8B1Q2_NELNU|nr:PREDICTED: uncharacterized protein LOC104609874 isoform X1 [Nelumbo nucifera]